MFPVIVLAAVLALISVRHYFIRWGRYEIWQIMCLGAVATVISGSISFYDAIKAINTDVIICLFGMFVIGAALEESGYLSHITYKMFKSARSLEGLFLAILIFAGLGSAFLMNDTIAIIGTPIVLLLARSHNINPRPLLMALAFAVTIGGVASPLGNPQNLLIATHGNIAGPFVVFAKYLLIPTVINLYVAFLFLKKFYAADFAADRVLAHSQFPVRNRHLAVLSKISVCLLAGLIVVKIFIDNFYLQAIGNEDVMNLALISLAASFPIIILSPKRFDVIRKVDYHTLLFFAGMFVLMRAVWDTDFFQKIIYSVGEGRVSSPFMIILVGIIGSQLISNVPLVALYLPLLVAGSGGSVKGMMLLAASSTIAGNFSIFGAASNVIIIHNAEKRLKTFPLSVWEFSKIGIPLTVANVLVYWIYFALFRG